MAKLIELTTSGEIEHYHQGIFVGKHFNRRKSKDGSTLVVPFSLNADKIENIHPVIYSVYSFKVKYEELSFLDKLFGIQPSLMLAERNELEQVNLTYILTDSGNVYYVDQSVDEIKKQINCKEAT